MSTLDQSSHEPQIRLVRSIDHGSAPPRGAEQRASDALLQKFYLFSAARLAELSKEIAGRVAGELESVRRVAELLGLDVDSVPELSSNERALAWEHVSRTATLCLLDDLVRHVHAAYSSLEVDGWARRVLDGLDADARAEVWEDTGLAEDDLSLAFAATANAMVEFGPFQRGVRLRYASGDLLLRVDPASRTVSGYHTARPVLGVVTTTPSARSWQPYGGEPVGHASAPTFEFQSLLPDIDFEDDGGERTSPGARPSTFRAAGAVAFTTNGSVRAVPTPHGFVLEGETPEDGLLAVFGGEELSVSIGVGEDGPEHDQAVQTLFAG